MSIKSFPATFSTGFNSVNAVVTGKVGHNYVGYTHSAGSRYTIDQYAAVWAMDGGCRYTAAGSNSSSDRSIRSIQFVAPGKTMYDKLDADGRAILAILANDRYTNNASIAAYLKDKLGAGNTQIDDIVDYALKQDFK